MFSVYYLISILVKALNKSTQFYIDLSMYFFQTQYTQQSSDLIQSLDHSR